MEFTKDIKDQLKESGSAYFELDGKKFRIMVEEGASDDEQNEWAVFQHKLDVLTADKIKEDSDKEARVKARIDSLEFCPKRKISDTGYTVELPASELISEATIIYNWLIKDIS